MSLPLLPASMAALEAQRRRHVRVIRTTMRDAVEPRVWQSATSELLLRTEAFREVGTLPNAGGVPILTYLATAIEAIEEARPFTRPFKGPEEALAEIIKGFEVSGQRPHSYALEPLAQVAMPTTPDLSAHRRQVVEHDLARALASVLIEYYQDCAIWDSKSKPQRNPSWGVTIRPDAYGVVDPNNARVNMAANREQGTFVPSSLLFAFNSVTLNEVRTRLSAYATKNPAMFRVLHKAVSSMREPAQESQDLLIADGTLDDEIDVVLYEADLEAAAHKASETLRYRASAEVAKLAYVGAALTQVNELIAASHFPMRSVDDPQRAHFMQDMQLAAIQTAISGVAGYSLFGLADFSRSLRHEVRDNALRVWGPELLSELDLVAQTNPRLNDLAL